VKASALPDFVTTWVNTQVAAFRTYEHASVHDGRQPRDNALAEWILQALAEGGCPATATIIDWVDRLNAGMEEAA